MIGPFNKVDYYYDYDSDTLRATINGQKTRVAKMGGGLSFLMNNRDEVCGFEVEEYAECAKSVKIFVSDIAEKASPAVLLLGFHNSINASSRKLLASLANVIRQDDKIKLLQVLGMADQPSG